MAKSLKAKALKEKLYEKVELTNGATVLVRGFGQHEFVVLQGFPAVLISDEAKAAIESKSESNAAEFVKEHEEYCAKLISAALGCVVGVIEDDGTVGQIKFVEKEIWECSDVEIPVGGLSAVDQQSILSAVIKLSGASLEALARAKPFRQ